MVVASFAIALMAGFTGLSLTRGARHLAPGPRKRVVAASAVILGGGIWSMHFVAMLGLQLPVLFFYDALITLISALIGILIVGLGLIVLHFLPRSGRTITAAGLIFGAGILAMHYVGMSGMEACRAEYSATSIAASVTLSLALSVLAIWVAYGERTRRNIVFGTLCFATAVVALHFLAVAGARFVATDLPDMPDLLMSNASLAFVVTLASFAICGLFLLSGATFLPVAQAAPAPAHAPTPERASEPDPLPTAPLPRTVPYEQNGRTLFADVADIAAFRAEGHYTIIYLGDVCGFCPWSISQAEARMAGTPFLRVHRSYLINPDHVSGFERRKDAGVAFFDGVPALEKVPVSRARLAEVRAALGV